MTLTFELIIFIVSVLFGILLYWRESNGNGVYRFFNKIINSKELQMKPTDKKGFVYRQSFLLRVVFITFLFLIGIVVARFLIPIDLATISLFTSMTVGTIVGTYVAGFVFKSGEVIDEKSDSLEDMVSDAVEKGKDIIEDLKSKSKDAIDDVKEDVKEVKEETSETVEKTEKSARDRLKDKGYM